LITIFLSDSNAEEKNPYKV